MSAHLGLLQSYGLNPKRSLSQNFLVDEQHLDYVVDAADLTAADTVLEIGPGLGVLTRRLAAHVKRVVAVELDDRLFEVLGETLDDCPNVRLVHGDILDLDPATLVASQDADGNADDGTYKVVANLPYNITSVVLRRLLEARRSPARLVVMVQKEVAERICAEPGQLSILAISIQFYAQPSIVHFVPADAFYPKPKVDSAVLRLDVYPQRPLPAVDAERFFRIVRAGFGQKRKQLLNSLSAGLHLPKPQIEGLLSQAGIDPRRRAQTLSLAEWGLLYDAMESAQR